MQAYVLIKGSGTEASDLVDMLVFMKLFGII